MANANTPNGFQYFGRLEGGSPTEGLTTRLIASSDTAALGYGDPVTSLATGYVSASVAGTTQIDGIFYGCEYLSTALGRVVFTNYWGGSGAAGDITAHLCTDPQAQFVVQSDNTAIVFADNQANINFVAGTPNATTQFSTATVGQSTINTTSTLPFRIVGLLSDSAPPGTNGADNTTAYNRVIVSPNNWDRKSLTGIV
jgi:hypothetical protein